MKFLLVAVNAKYIHSNPAVYSLKAYARERLGEEFWQRKGLDVEIAEYTINMRAEDILADLFRREPDVAAFSCYIWNWRMIREVAAELVKVLPGIPVWLGGPEVSFEAKGILEEIPAVKGIMLGEGEQTFTELLEYYGGGKEGEAYVRGGREGGKEGLGRIRGIIFRDGGGIFGTEEREPIEVGELPFYYNDLGAFRNRIIYYESARGCPFRCSYCLSAIDRSVRLRDMDTVKRELGFFLAQKTAQVKFVDRTFNCNRGHALEIWKFLREQDNGITNFHFEIAADLLGEEELALLSEMRPGLVQLEIGVQSTNRNTLREISRSTDLDRLRETVGRIHRGGNVHIHLDLIAGLPYEDYESFGRSFNEVYAMEPEQLQLGFLKVLKGSPLYEKAGSYGIHYTSQPPYEVLYSKWISYKEICRLKKVEEMVELYYNSNQFTYTLRLLEQVFESPFAMFGKLADYYEEKGYFINSPSRSYRYEVLLSFACGCDGGREELYRELLTYDIYLRENMKSRPAFAKDLSEYKGRIRDFYGDESRLREMLPDYGEYQPKQIARMTHAEVFRYPVWEAKTGGDLGEMKIPGMVVFDYARRSPLTGEAVVILL